MEQIVSKNNSLVKKLLKLKQKKYRDAYCLALIDGEKNVIEAYNVNALDTVVFTEKYLNSNLSCFKDKLIKKRFVTSEIINLLSSEATSQQILGVVKIKTQNKVVNPIGNFLILDSIQNPGNLGAILRSALATNFLDIYLYKCVDVYNPKVLNASAGNIFKLNVYNVNLEDVKQLANNSKIELCATVFNGENAFTFKPNNKKFYGIIMGNEGNGVSEDILKFASTKLTIPMQNNVESLNVAVAASLIMYNIEGGLNQ